MALGVVCLLAMAIPRANAATAPKDWAVILYRATADATNVTGAVSIAASGHPGAVVVLGAGMGASNQPGMVEVATVGGGPQQITTTSDLGGMNMTVGAPQSVDSASAGVGTYLTQPVRAGDAVAFLVFVAGADLTSYSTSIEPSEKFALESITGGTGSTVLQAASPNDSGAAVGAAYAAAGVSEHDIASPVGLAGGFLWWQFCELCAGTWSPDGSAENVWAAATTGPGDSFGTGPLSFAGPSGSWSWRWSGLGAESCFQGAPVYGAYAPIGNLWSYFQPESGNSAVASLCV